MHASTRAAPLLLFPIIALAVACARSQPSDMPAPADEDTREMCRGTSLPPGWLTMDSHWDRDRCPQNQQAEGDNVLTIWRFDNKPIGTEQQVCERSPTPPGWQAINHRWDPAHCRLGQGIQIFNVKTIRRVS